MQDTCLEHAAAKSQAWRRLKEHQDAQLGTIDQQGNHLTYSPSVDDTTSEDEETDIKPKFLTKYQDRTNTRYLFKETERRGSQQKSPSFERIYRDAYNQ